MGTRALIKVKGGAATIYQHWDGYPDHVLPWLQYHTARFIKERGNDPEYFLASLLRSTTGYLAEKFKCDKNELTGFGIVPKNATDYGSEYIYRIDLDKATITVDGKTIPIEINKVLTS